jgi:ABC transporter substrate binding protein (PQQ-dependent alcohol dehydrogenase system)
MQSWVKSVIYLLFLMLFTTGSLVQAKDKKSVTTTSITNQLIDIVYFTQEQVPPPALSNLDPFIPNKGLAGAELAIEDNNTTGQFIQQTYKLTPIVLPLNANVTQWFNSKVSQKQSLVLVNLPAARLLQLADLPQSNQKLFFDVASHDDELRNQWCRANIVHLLPSRAMEADALAQLMLKKRWTKWFLVIGNRAEDRAYASAIKRAAKKFGMTIVAEKNWSHTFDARRNEQAEVAVFTQVTDYDVLVLADEQGVFGEYFDYRTWLPRPVIGTQGLIATAWHPTHEQWGLFSDSSDW